MPFSFCWITGSHTILSSINGLLPPPGVEPTPFRNSASKVTRSQMHATTLGCLTCNHKTQFYRTQYEIIMRNTETHHGSNWPPYGIN